MKSHKIYTLGFFAILFSVVFCLEMAGAYQVLAAPEEPIVAYPYQDAFGLSIFDSDLELQVQDVGTGHADFMAPASMRSPFDAYGVAIVADQVSGSWMMNHLGEIISDAYNYIDINPNSYGSPTQGFEAFSSPNGVHTAGKNGMAYLLAPTGEVIYEVQAIINPFQGKDKTIIYMQEGYDTTGVGVISDAGEMLVPPKFSQIILVDDFHLLAQAETGDEHWQLLTMLGKTILEFPSINYPSVSRTDEGTFISAVSEYGHTLLYNTLGEVVLSVDHTTSLTVNQAGQYISPVYLENDNDQFKIYTMDGQTFFNGQIGTRYGQINADGKLPYVTDNSFGYINLKTREQEQVATSNSLAYFDFVGQTNVGKMMDNEGYTTFYDAALEEIPLPESYVQGPFQVVELDGIIYIYKQTQGYYVLDSQGVILADDALYARPAGKQLFIQEASGRTYLLDPASGSVTKEKN